MFANIQALTKQLNTTVCVETFNMHSGVCYVAVSCYSVLVMIMILTCRKKLRRVKGHSILYIALNNI